MEASAVPLSTSGLSVSLPAALDASVAVSRTVCRCNHHLLCISPTPALLPRLRKGAVNYSSAKCPLSADTIIGIQLWTTAGWMGKSHSPAFLLAAGRIASTYQLPSRRNVSGR